MKASYLTNRRVQRIVKEAQDQDRASWLNQLPEATKETYGPAVEAVKGAPKDIGETWQGLQSIGESVGSSAPALSEDPEERMDQLINLTNVSDDVATRGRIAAAKTKQAQSMIGQLTNVISQAFERLAQGQETPEDAKILENPMAYAAQNPEEILSGAGGAALGSGIGGATGGFKGAAIGAGLGAGAGYGAQQAFKHRDTLQKSLSNLLNRES